MKPLGRNSVMLLALVGCGVVMLGLAYASVPLYRLFCQATGFGGTTQRVTVLSQPQAIDRWVTVSFDGNVEPNLPWDFTPDVKKLRVKLGDVVIATYHAHNHGDRVMTGTASFNVQPDRVGSYFDKLQCFCFTKQVLKPGETAELPVQFYVDPALAEDRQTSDVQNITLSYTFFLAKEQAVSSR